MPTDTSVRSGGLLRERMIIRRTAEMLVAAIPPEELFPRICELVASQFGAHFVAIGETITSASRVRWSFAAPDSGMAALSEIPDEAIDRETPSLHPTSHDRVVLIVPLRYGDQYFGFLALGGGIRRFSSRDVSLIETCARYMAVAIYNVMLSQEKERLEALAIHDGLTGLHNRRAFDERLLFEWKRSLRSREPLSIVMVDVDYFKAYNDAYGHVAGDECLQKISGALMRSVSRAADMIARYGGEEFVGVLPNTPENGATDVAERMCRGVEELILAHRGSDLGRVSISVGVATMVPNSPNAQAGLVEAADAALYRAKEAGRNRVAGLDYMSVAPPARRRFDGRNNLPGHATSFVGRERELGAIARALPTVPTISLLGPGGVGKTRLAVAAAQTALAAFPGGAWLVELGAERDGSRVTELVAATMGVKGPTAPFEGLAEALIAAPALIILDSCEHLLEACSALVTQLVRRCPDARIVTTSRQPLGLPGEMRIRIDPFSLEDAVRLFIARALEEGQGALDDAGTTLVRRICRRVDGLPLAVELAAMRLGSMTLQQLAEQSASLPHQTALHDRVAWSFHLLDESERRFLARLSILEGPFDEEAARAIAGVPAFDPLESFDLLTRLVDKSLVQVDLESGRYRLLASIADYVRPRLGEFASPPEVRSAATRHYAGVAAALHESLRATARADAFTRYALVAENVDIALDWSLGGDDVETGAALAADMTPYWLETGRLSEARRRLDSAIARADALSRRRIVDVLDAAVDIAVARADALAVEVLADRLRDETGSTSNRAEMARVDFGLARSRTLKGDHAGAAELYAKSLAGFRAAGETRSIARNLAALAENAEGDGDIARAHSLLAEALELARLTGPPSLTSTIVGRLAELTSWSGSAEAAELIRDAAAQFSEIGDDASVSWMMLLLARHELDSDRIVARMHARDALERLRETAHPGRLASCFEFLAQIFAHDRDDATAIRLLGFAAALRRTHAVAGSATEAQATAGTQEMLQQRMSHEEFQRGLREGRTMALDAAIRYALSADDAFRAAPPLSPAPKSIA